jgi:uncharacterized protein (TIGR02265 family)
VGQQSPAVPATFNALTASSDDCVIDARDSWEDLTARVDLAPPDAKIRGMFLSEIKRIAPRAVKIESRYLPFSLYPVREYMDILLRTARIKYPGKSPANALLQLGTGVYSQFASSIAGTAILAVAQRNFRRVCEVAPKAYSVTLKPGDATATGLSPGQAVIQLRNVWVFPEIFHAGIWLGAMREAGVRGQMKVKCQSLCDVDLHMRWQDR